MTRKRSASGSQLALAQDLDEVGGRPAQTDLLLADRAIAVELRQPLAHPEGQRTNIEVQDHVGVLVIDDADRILPPGVQPDERVGLVTARREPSCGTNLALLLPVLGHGRPHGLLVLEGHHNEGLAGLDPQLQGLLENGSDRLELVCQPPPLPLAPVGHNREMGALNLRPFLGLALGEGPGSQEKDDLKSDEKPDNPCGLFHLLLAADRLLKIPEKKRKPLPLPVF